MATTITEWVGTTTDGSLGANWSNGLPDASTIHALLSGSSILSIATGWGAVRSRQTLGGALQPANTDTITIDSKVYTFQTVLTNVDGNVFIGADAETTHGNLKAAVNLETGAGSKYAAATTLHSTVTGFSAAAAASVYAAKDGGVAGDSLAVSDSSANWSWLGGTLENGAANGATMFNVSVEPEYPGNIHTSGTKALLNCGEFSHRGPGQMSLDIVNVTRLLVASPNYGLAADLIMTSSLTVLEIVTGRVALHAPSGTALPDRIIVSDLQSLSENLRLTGDSSLTGTQLIVAPGTVSVDGPDWTSIDNTAGTITIVDGAVATLRSSGTVVLEATDTMGVAYIMGGHLDLTQGPSGKTVTNIWLAPQASLRTRGTDIDTFTLHEIGV